LSAVAVGALLLVVGVPAAHAAQRGQIENVIGLPNGFQPEGIAIALAVLDTSAHWPTVTSTSSTYAPARRSPLSRVRAPRRSA